MILKTPGGERLAKEAVEIRRQVLNDETPFETIYRILIEDVKDFEVDFNDRLEQLEERVEDFEVNLKETRSQTPPNEAATGPDLVGQLDRSREELRKRYEALLERIKRSGEHLRESRNQEPSDEVTPET